MQNGNFVDAFAREDALIEEVLIDVGNRAGIDIEPRLAREESGEPGPRRGSDTHSHSRLQDAVASLHDLRVGHR